MDGVRNVYILLMSEKIKEIEKQWNKMLICNSTVKYLGRTSLAMRDYLTCCKLSVLVKMFTSVSEYLWPPGQLLYI